MSVIKSNGAGDQSTGFYNGVATQSLRFDDDGSAFLSKTPSSASTNLKAFTFSTWVKRANVFGASHTLFSAGANSNDVTMIRFEGNGESDTQLSFFNYTSGSLTTTLKTQAELRDPTAWYNIIVACDTTQSGANKAKIYVNGVLVDDWHDSSHDEYPNDDSTFQFGNNVAHRIGSLSYSTTQLFDGYMAETNFIAESQVAYTEFGELKNGIWIPKKYTGSYGGNGFRLQFKQTGTGTAGDSTIGADTANNNDYTSNGLDTYDSNMPDSPENNFAVLNPSGKQSSSALSEGNLKAVLTSGGNSARTPSTFAVSSGKWYWEVRQSSSNRFAMGVFDADTYVMTNEDGGVDAREWVFVTNDNSGAAARQNSGSMTTGYGGTVADGHVVMVALDVDNGAIWFGKQGSWFNTDGSADSATVKSQIEAGTTTNSAYTSVTGRLTPSFIRQTSNNTLTVNFGQDSTFHAGESAATNSDGNGNGKFQYAPPSGFLALCTDNLPEPVIGPNSDTQASDYFGIDLYTGNDGTQTRTTNFKPDWLWIKSRAGDQIHSHFQVDSSRSDGTKYLKSDTDNAEATDTTIVSTLEPSGSTGFTLGSSGVTNDDGTTYVAWHWKANGGSTTANDASSTSIGSRDSTFQANTIAGFSMVTYTGDGGTGIDTYRHGLQVNSVATTPELIICKNRQTTDDWLLGATAIPSFNWANDYMHWNEAEIHQTNAGGTAFKAAPTSTVFSVGEFLNKANNYIAYLFASVEGYSKIGFYTGTGSTSGTAGPYVFTGFRPAWIMLKREDTTGGSWWIVDSTRDPFNEALRQLQANLGDQETAYSGNMLDFYSNGFAPRTSGVQVNASGSAYLYMAFAEAPFKYANAR